MLTDEQVAFNKALRRVVTTTAKAEVCTPLSEEDKAFLLKKHGEESGRAAIARTEEGQRKRVEAVEEAKADLHYCEVRLMGILQRPLTAHERETGFGTYAQGAQPEHRWWLDPKAPVCPTCVPAEHRGETPRERVARLLPTLYRNTTPPAAVPEEPSVVANREEEGRRLRLKAALNEYLGSPGHAEGCDCDRCVPEEGA